MNLFSSNGQLGAHDSSFNITKLEQIVATLSAEPAWNGTQTDLVASCQNASSSSLSARQQAVYNYLCVRWSLHADCDVIQDTNGMLKDKGKKRRADFLAGEYDLSPRKLLEDCGLVRTSTLTKCSKGRYTGRYESALSRTLCLLEDFIGPDGRMDVSKLVMTSKCDEGFPVHKLAGRCAGTRQGSVSTYKYVGRCAGSSQGSVGTYKNVTAEEFVNCWAMHGVFSAAKQVANQVASGFPKDCSFDITKWNDDKMKDVRGTTLCY